MKIVTVAEMREMDRRTIEDFKAPSRSLMERAGAGVAHSVAQFAELCGFAGGFVHLIAGRGNNGGDAFVAARCLKDMGFGVEVWLAGSPAQLTGDAAFFYSKLKTPKINTEALDSVDEWEMAIRDPLYAEIIVDGVLGIGAMGPARGPAAGAIQYIRSQQDHALVVSIDVPSGLNADTGIAEGDAVFADVTVTIGLPKRGLVSAAARNHVGALDVVDIGLPTEVMDQAGASDIELIQPSDLRPAFSRRHRDTHKGDYGHALLIGGGGAYTGAMTLAARAAARSGVGLVTAIVPQSLRTVLASASPESMVAAAPESEEGTLTEKAIDVIRSFYAPGRAVVIGPGLTRSPAARALVEFLVKEAPGPLLVDADALVVAGGPESFARAKHPVVLTPHPGEAAALLGCAVEEIQSDRIAAVRTLAKRSRAVVVLKGAGTLVAAPDDPKVWINCCGNPGMAKGGSGDVLSGFLGGFLAQGIAPLQAACAAVYVHGIAGDFAALRRSQLSITASDIIAELSPAFNEISAR
ncbi:MAG: NAD(P)H-hydrate dehydratase [Kiritimatiellae bacterium]|nr:NAD(P)H-hydrate dehydratase [Kiritimatiellia bacterium]